MKRLIGGQVFPVQLQFKQAAGTSRGVYTQRKLWYIRLEAEDGSVGLGEAAPLPDLSADAGPNYESILKNLLHQLIEQNRLDKEALRPYPSILFAFETALLHLERGSLALFESDFAAGKEGIRINGLIWMGSYQAMRKQIAEKIEQGFRCIKLKIGAIDFEQELELLRQIRLEYPASQIELRVDANAAFSPNEALQKLEALHRLEIHSIEQPIAKGQFEAMRQLAMDSPLPIALDEELIGVVWPEDKERLLDKILPSYIILKPSLHGGISGCKEWIELAEKRSIGWWFTSALESNIGLNAIAQLAACYPNKLAQGLGTGLLFTSNAQVPLMIHGERLFYQVQDRPSSDIDILPLGV